MCGRVTGNHTTGLSGTWLRLAQETRRCPGARAQAPLRGSPSEVQATESDHWHEDGGLNVMRMGFLMSCQRSEDHWHEDGGFDVIAIISKGASGGAE